MSRPAALLIKPTEGKTFRLVVSKIRFKMEPENSEVEMSFIRNAKGGGVLVEVGPKTTSKITFYEALKGLLAESSVEI